MPRTAPTTGQQAVQSQLAQAMGDLDDFRLLERNKDASPGARVMYEAAKIPYENLDRVERGREAGIQSLLKGNADTPENRASAEGIWERTTLGPALAAARASAPGLRQALKDLNLLTGPSTRTEAQEGLTDMQRQKAAQEVQQGTELAQQRALARKDAQGNETSGFTDVQWYSQQRDAHKDYLAERRAELGHIVQMDASKRDWAKFEYEKDHNEQMRLERQAAAAVAAETEIRRNELTKWQTETNLESSRYATDTRSASDQHKADIDQRGQDLDAADAYAKMMASISTAAMGSMISQSQWDGLNDTVMRAGGQPMPFTSFNSVYGQALQAGPQAWQQQFGGLLPPQVGPPQMPQMNAPMAPQFGGGMMLPPPPPPPGGYPFDGSGLDEPESWSWLKGGKPY
jgi:hypothetical protein